MGGRLLSTVQVAKRLGVTRQTVLEWCHAGRFPNAQHVGKNGRGLWLIPESDLDRFEKPKRGRPRKK